MAASNGSWPLKILLAVDGSQDAEAAVNLLSRIAWPAGTLIHVLTTTPEPGSWIDSLVDLHSEVGQRFARLYQQSWFEPGSWINSLVDFHSEVGQRFASLYQQSWFGTRTLAGQIAHSLHTNNVVVKTEILQGSATSVILERATELAAHLIVVGAKGFNAPAHTALGSTAARIAYNQDARYSVLVARPSAQMQPLSVILVMDSSFEVWPAVEFLCALSLSNWAKVTIVYVAKERDSIPVGALAVAGYASPSPVSLMQHNAEAHVAKVLNRLHACGARGWSHFRCGNVADEALSAAQEQAADLIVIGAGADSSLTQRVVASAPCSVLVVNDGSKFNLNV
ncbi:MAG: universal stress protein [Anaerolineae bacterium]